MKYISIEYKVSYRLLLLSVGYINIIAIGNCISRAEVKKLQNLPVALLIGEVI